MKTEPCGKAGEGDGRLSTSMGAAVQLQFAPVRQAGTYSDLRRADIITPKVDHQSNCVYY